MPKEKRRRRKSGCRSKCKEISRVAGSIKSEIQSWIDCESVGRLVSALWKLTWSSSSLPAAEEDALVGFLRVFEERLSRGFNRGLQDVVLRLGAFPTIAAVLATPFVDLRLREGWAMVRFNHDLSSLVLRSLVAMRMPSTMRVLQYLVAAIKIALVDEMHADGQFPGIVGFLSSPDTNMAVAALDLLLQVAYYVRKEAVDCKIEASIVKWLVVLQRSDLGGSLIEMDEGDPCAAVECGCEEEARRRV
ncbi:hypothetical protein Taro_033168 [Colocasia esculenta]|uniref:Uncharacterized protein n=1 Tax=Colocasia esculenta TaxID=4460 RepID=A0A843W0Y3_COLES|nr:hypothetical protein [Colocasia esculenta]